MKSIARGLLALLLVLLVTSSTYAQIELGIGLKGGLNFASISFSPELQLPAGATKGGRTGMMIGAAAELGFAKMFYVAIEPTYCGKGCSFTQGSVTQTIAYNFLNIPVLFKVKFLKGMVRPYAFVGPNLGILLSATSSTTGLAAGNGDTDIKATTSGSDFALDFGGGAEFNIVPKIAITGDVRYSLGLSNLNNATVAAGATQTKYTTGGFQILFGAMFHIL